MNNESIRQIDCKKKRMPDKGIRFDLFTGQLPYLAA